MVIIHQFDESINGGNTDTFQMPLDPWCEANQFPGTSEIKITLHWTLLRPPVSTPLKTLPSHLSLSHA